MYHLTDCYTGMLGACVTETQQAEGVSWGEHVGEHKVRVLWCNHPSRSRNIETLNLEEKRGPVREADVELLRGPEINGRVVVVELKTGGAEDGGSGCVSIHPSNHIEPYQTIPH